MTDSEKRVSLHPLNLTEAVRVLVRVEPKGKKEKRRRKKTKSQKGGGKEGQSGIEPESQALPGERLTTSPLPLVLMR